MNTTIKFMSINTTTSVFRGSSSIIYYQRFAERYLITYFYFDFSVKGSNIKQHLITFLTKTWSGMFYQMSFYVNSLFCVSTSLKGKKRGFSFKLSFLSHIISFKRSYFHILDSWSFSFLLSKDAIRKLINSLQSQCNINLYFKWFSPVFSVNIKIWNILTK